MGADLLDVLSNGSQPHKILVHTNKIFLCCKTLELDIGPEDTSRRPKVTKWISNVGQEDVIMDAVPVPKYDVPKGLCPLEGKAEIYLKTVVEAMKSTLFLLFEGCLESYDKLERSAWVMEGGDRPTYPAMTILAVSSVSYVRAVEIALPKVHSGEDTDALKAYNDEQSSDLLNLIDLTRTKINGGQRKRIMCMITLDAHNRDIIHNFLFRDHVTDIKSFKWQSQLKLYFRKPYQSWVDRDGHLRSPEGQRLELGQLNAVLPYDYEYLGNGPRLVVTPLTDRIYVTQTQALHLKMGCAPAGPAGTGKTETVKDLANALGKQCYVMNCSPEMDYLTLGNIWSGLASSGAWGCFDEFNRLYPEVLSVCAVQFKAITDGLRANSATIVIEGAEIALDPVLGAFTTMNPGYLGRAELPEALKALFRPMTVMVPDMSLICENMLMAEGFTEAKLLASKFYGLYSLLMMLLSAQLHYDWGLRAVKSVLVVAGSMKRASPDVPEDHTLMRALRDFNNPKIVAEDRVVFFGLLGDLFPGINPPRVRDPEFEKHIAGACADLHLFAHEEFVLKVTQWEELLSVRHSNFLMGAPGAGKSQVFRALAKAQTFKGLKTRFVDINPKAVTTKELYGYITMATREWRDGVLSKTMRDLGNIPDELPKWLVLDGDLDANWIESMNSVMDDNKMLTLASNERIPLKAYKKMIFEIRDLRFASPATVSRAGILYIATEEGYQWRCIVKSFIEHLKDKDDDEKEEHPAIKEKLQELFDDYMPGTLLEIAKFFEHVVHTEAITMVQSTINMLKCLLPCLDFDVLKGKQKKVVEEDDDEDGPKAEQHEDVPWDTQLETAFVYCAVWACGSGFD